MRYFIWCSSIKDDYRTLDGLQSVGVVELSQNGEADNDQ